MESDARDIIRVTFKGHHRIRVRRFDIEQFDICVTRCCEVALVRRDAKSVNLRVRVLEGARTDAREGLPEPFFPSAVSRVACVFSLYFNCRTRTECGGHTPLRFGMYD